MIERFESSNGARIYRIPVEAFPNVVRFLLLLCVCLSAVRITSAQDGATPYIVTGVVHARSCARLTCPVVSTFQPDDQIAVTEVVTGDRVLGNNQWVAIEVDGAALYIPGGSVIRVSDAALIPDAEPEAVDTSGWDQHETERFSISMPVNWRDFSNWSIESMLGSLSEFYDQATLQSFQTIGNPDNHSMFFDVSMGASLQVLYYDLNGATAALERFNSTLRTRYEALGAEVIAEGIVSLPAGEAARLHIRMAQTFNVTLRDMDMLWYAVVVDDTAYILVFSNIRGDFADVEPIFAAIAATFAPLPLGN